MDPARRAVLQRGGLALAFTLLPTSKALAMVDARRQPNDAAAAMADGNPAFAPNAFIRIDAEGPVRLVMPMVEMGQGIYTGSAMLIAEELGVDMDQIAVEHSPPDAQLYGMPLLHGQITGGSTSTRSTYRVLREAGAVARTLLVSAAAARWRVEPATCTVTRGMVSHVASGRSLAFGKLAADAARLPMPGEVVLKSPKDFRLVGKPFRRVDSADKVTGATRFGIDVRLPGMKVATVMACPILGGMLGDLDDRATRQIPGVVDVLRIGNAVAVVGDHFWAAKKGLEALVPTWRPGPNAAMSTDSLRASLVQGLLTGRALVGREVGTKPAGRVIAATYQLPMLAHATMEPLNATVHVTPGKCEIWAGSQVPTRAVDAAVRITGLPVSSVVFHNQYIGGGFGRRLEADYVEQAVAFARQVAYPVKMIWTREEDIRHDIVRPMYQDNISAVLNDKGLPAWLGDRICSSSVLARFAPYSMRADGLDRDAIESVADNPYDIPSMKVEWIRQDQPAGLVLGWWRGVGAAHNLFTFESFVDELAHEAGRDPVDYRRQLLHSNPRTLALLERASQAIGWAHPPTGERIGRGVAVGEPFGSRVCAIVEVEVVPDGRVTLRRAVVAVDCGVVINQGSVEAQIQGGLLFGLSAALYSKITIREGRIEQSNFHDYRVLRIDEVPEIEVICVHSDEAPGGIGELATAIAAPALCNAIFAATGIRLRELCVDSALLAENAARHALASTEGSVT